MISASGRSRLKRQREARADEPGSAGDQNAHAGSSEKRHAMISRSLLPGDARQPLSLDSLYATRFPEADRAGKDAIWQVLCPHFFQRYVKPDDVVLDIGAGFGEFLRHIKCRHRIAVDIEKLSGASCRPGPRKSSRRATSCRERSPRTPSTSSSAATSSSTCPTRRRSSRRWARFTPCSARAAAAGAAAQHPLRRRRVLGLRRPSPAVDAI